MADNENILKGQGEMSNEVVLAKETSYEYDPTDKVVDDDLSDIAQDEPKEAEGTDPEADKVEDPKEEDEGDQPEAVEDLGELTDENLPKYEERYYKEGVLDEGIVSKEFWGNGQDEQGNWKGLHENTYKFLEEKKGIPKALAKQVEAALVAQHEGEATAEQARVVEVFNEVGGADAYGAALQWARDGGYDDAGKKRYNAILDGKDFAAKEDAIMALMSRYRKANPEAAAPAQKSAPRDITQGKGTKVADADVFKSTQEYRAARDAAGDNQAARRQVAIKLKRSQDLGLIR